MLLLKRLGKFLWFKLEEISIAVLVGIVAIWISMLFEYLMVRLGLFQSMDLLFLFLGFVSLVEIILFIGLMGSMIYWWIKWNWERVCDEVF